MKFGSFVVALVCAGVLLASPGSAISQVPVGDAVPDVLPKALEKAAKPILKKVILRSVAAEAAAATGAANFLRVLGPLGLAASSALWLDHVLTESEKKYAPTRRGLAIPHAPTLDDLAEYFEQLRVEAAPDATSDPSSIRAMAESGEGKDPSKESGDSADGKEPIEVDDHFRQLEDFRITREDLQIMQTQNLIPDDVSVLVEALRNSAYLALQGPGALKKIHPLPYELEKKLSLEFQRLFYNAYLATYLLISNRDFAGTNEVLKRVRGVSSQLTSLRDQVVKLHADATKNGYEYERDRAFTIVERVLKEAGEIWQSYDRTELPSARLFSDSSTEGALRETTHDLWRAKFLPSPESVVIMNHPSSDPIIVDPLVVRGFTWEMVSHMSRVLWGPTPVRQESPDRSIIRVQSWANDRHVDLEYSYISRVPKNDPIMEPRFWTTKNFLAPKTSRQNWKLLDGKRARGKNRMRLNVPNYIWKESTPVLGQNGWLINTFFISLPLESHLPINQYGAPPPPKIP